MWSNDERYHSFPINQAPLIKLVCLGYIQNDQAIKAIDIFKQIKDPNEVNILLLFNACAQLQNEEALHLVKQVAEQMPQSYYSNSTLVNSLLDALMKCGDVESAQSLFDQAENKTLHMCGAMMKGIICFQSTKLP